MSLRDEGGCPSVVESSRELAFVIDVSLHEDLVVKDVSFCCTAEKEFESLAAERGPIFEEQSRTLLVPKSAANVYGGRPCDPMENA